jgi:hypothetical protein
VIPVHLSATWAEYDADRAEWNEDIDNMAALGITQSKSATREQKEAADAVMQSFPKRPMFDKPDRVPCVLPTIDRYRSWETMLGVLIRMRREAKGLRCAPKAA